MIRALERTRKPPAAKSVARLRATGQGPFEPIFAGGWVDSLQVISTFSLAPQATDIASHEKT